MVDMRLRTHLVTKHNAACGVDVIFDVRVDVDVPPSLKTCARAYVRRGSQPFSCCHDCRTTRAFHITRFGGYSRDDTRPYTVIPACSNNVIYHRCFL